MDLHPDISALAASLREMSELLRKYQSAWADMLDRCTAFIEKSDFYGIEEFLRLYGGMGSLNDIVLYHEGGPVDWNSNDNDRFAQLRTLAFEQARKLSLEEAAARRATE